MASTVTVTIKYKDGSKSLKESFTCADTHPSAEILKDLENQQLKKWTDMGGQYRDVQIHTRVGGSK